MTDPQTPEKSRPHRAAAKGQKARRAEALTAALRDNLRRRKAAVADAPAVAPEDHEKARDNGSQTT